MDLQTASVGEGSFATFEDAGKRAMTRMNALVPLEVFLARESIAAVTHPRALVVVDRLFVRFQGASMSKRRAAAREVTHVWSSVRMNPLMHLEIALFIECCITAWFLADKGFLVCMNCLMDYRCALCGESFGTSRMVTRKCTQACVHRRMAPEVFWGHESSRTAWLLAEVPLNSNPRHLVC